MSLSASDAHDIRAVAFDAFGTLVRICDHRRPYRRLLELLAERGRPRQPDDPVRIMSHPGGLGETARMFGWDPPPEVMESLEADLQHEVQSIALYEESALVLTTLRERGYRIAICSNLAAPYGHRVLRLLPFPPDVLAWSYEVGAVKPDLRIYQALLGGLALQPDQVLFVGDTPEADVAGPNRIGMTARLLGRNACRPSEGMWPDLTAILDELPRLADDESRDSRLAEKLG